MLRAIVVALSLFVASPGGSPLESAEAQAAFDEAMAAFERGDYAEAEAALKRAYHHEPDPELLYARAQMLRSLGDCERAATLYRAYLATNPAKREDAEENLARCLALLETQGASSPGPTAIAAEPEPAPAGPLQPAPQPTPQPRRWRPDGWTVALGSVGLVATGVGAALVPVSIRGAAQASGRTDHQGYRQDYTRARRGYVAGVIVLSVGSALLVATVVQAIVRARRGPDPARAAGRSSVGWRSHVLSSR